MQIILLKDVNKLGKRGEVKNVADGFAMNFLLPQKLAQPATPVRIEQINQQTKKQAQQKINENQCREELLKKLKDLKLEIKAKVSAGGKLFAGLSAKEIAQALKRQKGIEVEEKFIKLEKKIKEVGEYTLKVRFSVNLQQEIKLIIKAAD